MTEKFNLDREISIDKNVDALGKKWNIVHIRGTALYKVIPDPAPHNYMVPKNMQGLWTKPSLLDDEIKKYLKESWDLADAKANKR